MVHYFKFTIRIFNINCLTLKLIEKIWNLYFSNNSILTSWYAIVLWVVFVTWNSGLSLVPKTVLNYKWHHKELLFCIHDAISWHDVGVKNKSLSRTSFCCCSCYPLSFDFLCLINIKSLVYFPPIWTIFRVAKQRQLRTHVSIVK